MTSNTLFILNKKFWAYLLYSEEMSVSRNWILVISEQHRYQGVSYKSDIAVISGRVRYKIFIPAVTQGMDHGDRQVLEQKYSGYDPPCLLDSSDGRWARKIFLYLFPPLLIIPGLFWKDLPTTPCMWWTAWWSEEDTKCRGIHSRGLCLTFIIRMISKTLPNIHNNIHNRYDK